MRNNSPEKYNSRKFLQAVNENDLNSIKFFILNESGTASYLSFALFKASGFGHVKIVELLIASGADVNYIVGLGTPLTEAVENKQIEVIYILLRAGANCSLPLYGEVYPPLFIAAENGDLEIVKLLVNSGANINQMRGEDYPLCTAAGDGQEQVFNYLYPLTNSELHQEALDLLPEGIRMREIEEAADPLVIDLISAVFDRNIEEVKQLLAAGADVNGFGLTGSTALFMAVRKQSVELVQLLLEAGANPNQNDLEDGRTPLMVTYDQWSTSGVQICSLLLETGADVNARDIKEGKTVLMHNVDIPSEADELFKENCRKIVQALLQRGADVNAKENNGNTALTIAKEAGHNDIIQRLKEVGATDN